MDYGEGLASLGKLNVMLIAGMTTIVCVISAFNILRNDTVDPTNTKFYAIGVLFITAAITWMMVWLCNNYTIIAQLSGVAFLFSIIYTMIYGIPPKVTGMLYVQ